MSDTPEPSDENEVLLATRRAKAAKARTEGDDRRRLGWKGAAAVAGIGSAALAAALLYANRNKG